MEAKNLLITDLEYVRGSFWRSEEIGEKRFGFFVSVVTAAVAGLIALSANEAADFTKITNWAILALLVFGLLTYIRMLQRNATSDGYKMMSDEIWDVGLQLCPELNEISYKLNWGTKTGLSKWARAGLAETIGVINGALFGAYLAYAFKTPITVAVVAGVIAAAIPWWISTRRQ